MNNLSGILNKVPYFADLEPSILQDIAQQAIAEDYLADTVLFLEGEPCSGLFIVEYGWLKAMKTSLDGRDQVLHYLGAGEVFNSMSVFAELPNPATVMSLEKTRVWRIPQAAMLQFLEEYPLLARRIIKDLSQRILHLANLVEDLSLRTVEGRLARYLLSLADDDTIVRQTWATQAEMASRLGTVPDVLHRILRSLSDEGIIKVGRRRIDILDRAALEARAMLDSS
jgi:CRP/FNR family transcriptional regulator